MERNIFLQFCTTFQSSEITIVNKSIKIILNKYKLYNL